jgi:hypothetical protein
MQILAEPAAETLCSRGPDPRLQAQAAKHRHDARGSSTPSLWTPPSCCMSRRALLAGATDFRCVVRLGKCRAGQHSAVVQAAWRGRYAAPCKLMPEGGLCYPSRTGVLFTISIWSALQPHSAQLHGPGLPAVRAARHTCTHSMFVAQFCLAWVSPSMRLHPVQRHITELRGVHLPEPIR